ncbi:hypothetical protein HAX54_025275 [Datura stramonium]|uniref:Uncharacterized protein n=1 Tax=Datura stramonium TaxID=4076 RepID=A0ABS8S6F2_DATST|nr:hypothetical protein [Datura stramonium]
MNVEAFDGVSVQELALLIIVVMNTLYWVDIVLCSDGHFKARIPFTFLWRVRAAPPVSSRDARSLSLSASIHCSNTSQKEADFLYRATLSVDDKSDGPGMWLVRDNFFEFA